MRKRILNSLSGLLLLLFFLGATWLQGTPCAGITSTMKLPVEFDTEGKPRRAKWELVDKTLTRLREEMGAKCQLRFDDIFRTDKKELYVPLTNNMIRTAPEGALDGLMVFDKSGNRLGEYVGRVTYNRSGGLYVKQSYTLYYFQYRDGQGKLQSSGSRLLLDDYLVRWSDLKSRTAVNSTGKDPEF